MNTLELRKLIQEFPKYPGTKMITPALVCNEGFPGNFNLSFTEDHWLQEFDNQYVDYSHDFIFSKIQPCIRHQDWEIIKAWKEHSYRYLSIFDMADISGAISLVDKNKHNEITKFAIENLIKFFSSLGLSLDKLRVKYCVGGGVSHLTKGKYPFDFTAPRDPAIEYWKLLGLTEDQFIADDTRDSWLSLNIYGLPTPWGYRNEIFYEHQGRLLDIATVEHLMYRPIIDDNKNIVELKNWEHSFAISAVGVERLLMVINNFARATDCDHIRPLIDLVLSISANKSDHNAIVLTEAIRTVHRIVTDAGSYINLSRGRKTKIKHYYRGAMEAAGNLSIPLSHPHLRTFFKTNANLQTYYPELAGSVELCTKEMLEAINRINKKQKSVL